MMQKNKDDNTRYMIPRISYEDVLAVLDRITDITKATIRTSLFRRTTFTIHDGRRTRTIRLSRKGLDARTTFDGKVVATAHIGFPAQGRLIAAYDRNCSAFIIKSFESLTVIVPLRGVSEDGIQYLMNGSVQRREAKMPPSPVPPPEEEKHGIDTGAGEETTYRIIRDADVPPMESFRDMQVPYAQRCARQTKTPALLKDPFHRRNEAVMARCAGGDVEIYTDGGMRPCGGNVGSWAYAVIADDSLALLDTGAETGTDIGRMELTAAVKALHSLLELKPSSVTLYTDSKYVRNGAEVWWKGWLEADGSLREGIANADLWSDLIETRRRLQEMFCEVTFEWVKGHSGNRWNTFVDRKNDEILERLSKNGGMRA